MTCFRRSLSLLALLLLSLAAISCASSKKIRSTSSSISSDSTCQLRHAWLDFTFEDTIFLPHPAMIIPADSFTITSPISVTTTSSLVPMMVRHARIASAENVVDITTRKVEKSSSQSVNQVPLNVKSYAAGKALVIVLVAFLLLLALLVFILLIRHI